MSDPSSAPERDGDAPDPLIDREALDHLFSVTYEELRRLASRVKRSDWNASISPTTLVNEAWMKLAASPSFRSTSPLHFKRIAARAMRQVLVEAARRRHAARRGGEHAVFVTFDESIGGTTSAAHDLLALDAALDDLARINPRQAAMVECRYFGGLDVAEAAALLDVSEAIVHRGGVRREPARLPHPVGGGFLDVDSQCRLAAQFACAHGSLRQAGQRERDPAAGRRRGEASRAEALE
jgi:RNA polymerase sigma factor (TIGR02999 family)